MVLQESFINALLQADDEYETIAACYSELLSYIEDTDVKFITTYIGHLAADPEFGPYANDFATLRQSVIKSAYQTDMNGEDCGTGFEVFRSKLLLALKQFRCPAELPLTRCTPMCMFYVIEALDLYVEHNLQELDAYDVSEHGDCGPLNQGTSQEQCLVYLQEQESFLSGAYDAGDWGGFRKPLHQTRIGNLFHTVLLFERKRLLTPPENPPQIVRIPLSENFKDSILKQKKIFIASIPYIGFDTFQFHSSTKAEACKPGEIPDGMFYVEYPETWEADNIRRVLGLLDLAILNGAHIVIFPEFIMSMGMKNAIQNHLSNLTPESRRQLLLVFAGTCYQREDGGKGNNVLYMFNSRGMEVGSYYKYSPFLIQSEEQFHGAKFPSTKHGNSRQFRQYCDSCELLSNPGKVCVLLDIDVIGRVLPAICRDVTDGEYTTRLAELFMPSLLVVPAWSRSVHSFESRLSVLANTIHTASFLCNCCNAVRGNGEEVMTGMFCLPAKQRSHMNAAPVKFGRNAICAAACQNHGGCMVQIELDFSQGMPEGRIISTVSPVQENRA